ncbi:MAG TPA: ATP-binding protein [Cyclobacteriaceae bacterium]|nr:ATP-binding protein [Cyclobacteriaceae bacterium]
MKPLPLIFALLGLLTSLSCPGQPGVRVDSWEQVYSTGQGEITVYWYTSKPFIYKDRAGEIHGIEAEIMKSFAAYLKEAYKIDLTIHWEEEDSFLDTYQRIRERKTGGAFGASVFSITAERQREVGFTPPYMSDISVLISSYDVPIVKDAREFDEVFTDLKAITIEGTTYEQDLKLIREQRKTHFQIEYIPSSENVLRSIEERQGAFGFIDLPIYLTEFSRNAAVRVKRQNVFPIRREGYSIIYPKNSDWQTPLEEYFLSNLFKKEIEAITEKYIDIDVYRFLQNLYLNAGNREVLLLTKEKEIQNRDLLDKSEMIRRETGVRNFLIMAVIIFLVFLVVIYQMYRIRTKTAMILVEQKRQIESQRLDIESRKTELERRNQKLTDLNEEKNHLIKVLAHDLRTPIGHIDGLAHLIKMEKDNLTGSQQDLLDKIRDAASRLNQMITKILDVDAIESSRINLKPERVDVASQVKQIVSGFEKEAARKRISLTYGIGDDPLIVQTDALYLTQIVENLISNAIKFSPPGKMVNVSLQSENGYVQLCVRDHGPGFTEADKQNLFKKFHRLSAQPTGNEQSTGLGLSIVKRYTDLMKGDVWCESEPGKGAAFYVRLHKHPVIG